jgi:hypothetical protein
VRGECIKREERQSRRKKCTELILHRVDFSYNHSTCAKALETPSSKQDKQEIHGIAVERI